MNPVRKFIWLLFPVLTIFFTDGLGQNQHYSFEFRGESLIEALDIITKTSEIDLVYDPQLVSGQFVYKRIQQKTVQETLKSILSDFQLDYLILSSGTIVIVRSVAEGPFFGTLSGKIMDAQTGEPLPGATVLLADASGGTSTNRSGNFSLNRLKTGTHTIIFSYVGYDPVIKTFDIGPNEEVREQVSLQSKPVDVMPIVVESHRRMLPFRNSLSNPNNPEWQSAGTMSDAIRSLSVMHGIQYGLPVTQLSLQGGQHGEHRIFLDRLPVYNPFSFGHLFSSFSPYAIGKIEVEKAGYGVDQGSHIAGLINLSHDQAELQNKRVSFQADPLSINLRGDLGFQTANESTVNIMTALRTNFWNIYRDPSLKQTLKNWDVLDPLIMNAVNDIESDASFYVPFFHDSDVHFFDYHLAASYKPGPFSTLSGTLYIADNSIETQLLNQRRAGPDGAPFIFASDRHNWNNIVAGLSWNKMLTPRFDLSAKAGYSKNQFRHHNRAGTTRSAAYFTTASRNLTETMDSPDGYIGFIPLPAHIDGNHIQHALARLDASYSISPRFSIDGGLQADLVQSEVDIADVTNRAHDIQTAQSSSIINSYLMSRHRFGTYWSIDWGTRFTYASHANDVFAEPRASIQFDNTDSEVGNWSARLSGGLYRQFINEYRMTNTGPTAIVPSFSIWSHADGSEIPKAWHLNGSFLLEPSPSTTFTIEGYYKWQPVANITSYTKLGDQTRFFVSPEHPDEISAFGETTQSTALGGGIRVAHSMANSRLKILAGYDYSYVNINMDTQFGRAVPASWNEPHRMQLRAFWHVFQHLTVVPKWQGILGRTWAFREAYYNFLPFRSSNTGLPFNFDTPENDTLPSFYQFDLSLIYRPTPGPVDFELSLDLINLLNRKNVLDQYLKPVIEGDEISGYEIRNRTLPGFYPSASLRIVF